VPFTLIFVKFKKYYSRKFRDIAQSSKWLSALYRWN